MLCGGVQAKEGELEKGCFLRPTFLGDVTNDMRVAQEEIFGPVACILKFKTEEEVLAMANDSAYGLGRCCLDQRYQSGPARGKRRGNRPHVGQHLQCDPGGCPLWRLQGSPASEERPTRSSWITIPR